VELTGRRLLHADRATAWRALNDPGVLKASIPGCESLEKSGENAFSFTGARVLKSVHARFHGMLRVEDRVPDESCTLGFDTDDGEGGFARGRVKVSLSSEGADTALEYDLAAQVGGRMAQVGNRLIDSAARKAMDDFFIAFEKRVSGATFGEADAVPLPGKPFSVLQHALAAAILVALVASVAYTLG
jgi:carbon monoxide dehydrogenase subunit G